MFRFYFVVRFRSYTMSLLILGRLRGEKQGQTLPAKRELILIVDVTLRERGLTPFLPTQPSRN